MNNLFFWLIPPIVGAVIGYVTNAVAIKMLFRPLKAYYICKIRIPFTPGILPKQRHKLADNIGLMVERELLTPEILRERMNRSDVKAALSASIASYTARLLNKPLSTVKTIPDNPFSILFREFFGSPAFDCFIDDLINTIIAYIGESDLCHKSIKDIIGASNVYELEIRLQTIVETQLKAQAQSINDAVIAIVEKEIPRLSCALMQFLNRKEIRKELEIHGHVFLSKVLLKLGTFQRMFLSMGHYDETLQKRMPEIIDDLVVQIKGILNDEKMHKNFLDMISGVVEQFLLNEESVKSLSKTLASHLILYADVPLEELLGAASFDARNIFTALLQTIKDNVFSNSFWAYLFEKYQSMTLSAFFSIDGQKKEDIDLFLAEAVLSLVKNEIDSLLSSINIRAMVSERIDSLDMLSVERIVLDVMANQFKWINVFGAILGSLIGLCQVFLNAGQAAGPALPAIWG